MNRAEIEIAVLQEAKQNLQNLLDNILVEGQMTKYGIMMSILEIQNMIDETETQND
jgi:hypothetical protein